MELYESQAELNFNLNSHLVMEFEDTKDLIILSKNSSNGSDSCDGTPRTQANARERFRTHRFEFEKFSDRKNLKSKFFSVNSAFNTLRLLIPTEPKNRKLSKIETLRLAKSYISHLHATLLSGEKNKFSFTKKKILKIYFLRKFNLPTTLPRRLFESFQFSTRLSLKYLHILCLLSHSSKED